MNLNFLRSKPIDYVNIVYFKNKGKLSSFTLSYRLFSFLRNLVILGVIWIPISAYIISVQLTKRIMSEKELTKNRDVILAYQDRIDSLYTKTYSDPSTPPTPSPSNTESGSDSTSSTTPNISDSSSTSTPEASTNLGVNNEVSSTSQVSTPTTPNTQESSFPVDIKDLKYSYSDNTLDITFNLASVVHPKSHKGRLLIVAFLDKKDDSDPDTTIIYPGYTDGKGVPDQKTGESFKVASFKTVSAKFVAPEGRKIVSFKIICHSNETSSPMERNIVL